MLVKAAAALPGTADADDTRGQLVVSEAARSLRDQT